MIDVWRKVWVYFHMELDWDQRKDAANRRKHHLSFLEARHAFLDPDRIIAIDARHSTVRETRYFCFGKVEERVMTVRFTVREEKIAFLALVIGEKDGRNMKKKNGYSDAPTDVAEAIKEAKVIDDFLPPPDELIPRDDTVKVTISLTKKSVDFFKKSASMQGVPYQTMIRKVLDLYSQRYKR